MQECIDEFENYNYQQDLGGVRLTWLDCNNYILMEELTTAERQWRCWGTAPCHAAEPFLWSLDFDLLGSRETLLHVSNKIFVEHARYVAKKL